VTQTHDPSTIASQVLALLREQKRGYQELQELAEQQRSLIRAEQPEELLNLLARRQRLIETIARTHRQLVPCQKDWEGVKALLPQRCRDEIQSLLAEIQALLNVVLARDQEDCQELSARKQHVAGQLTAAVRGRAANQAYTPNQAPKTSAGRAGMNFEING
jgi:hypothetical protein